MDRQAAIRFGLSLFVMLTVPAAADVVLADAGRPLLGQLAWGVLFVAGAAWMWYRWVRPLEITGPTGAEDV